MKHALLTALMLTLAHPALAQSTDDPGRLDQGLERLGEEAGALLEGFLQEMTPLLEGLNETLSEGLSDLSAYHAPEILPNGDILIRRKTPADSPPPAEADRAAPDGPIDL